ncbi:MAG: sigma-70 family RNA polymerase sigma factor [Planctomycetota bacterium]
MSGPIDERSLLEHADFVRAVARKMLDEHRAEDVVQDTMLAAIEQRDTLRRDVRGWLATVARNFARMSLRGEARRATREQHGRTHDPADTPDTVAARLEAQRRIVDAVRALPETYRVAVTLRYFEGLSPAEIARREDIPQKTVHTRLRRAIERLRNRLDGDYGGDGRAWMLALAPLVKPAKARWAAATASAIAGLATPTKFLIVIGVVAAGWFTLGFERGDASSAERVNRTGSPSDHAAAATPSAASGPAGLSVAERSPDESSALSKPTMRVSLTGRIVRALEGDGAASVSAFAVSNLDLRTGQPVVAKTSRDNTFALDATALLADPAVSQLEILVDHERHLAERVRVDVLRNGNGPRIKPVVIRLRAAAVVRGLFDNARGAPIAQAPVALFRTKNGTPIPPAVTKGRTGPGGRYRLRAPDGGPHMVLGASPDGAPAHARVLLAIGRVTDAATLHSQLRAAIRGTVTVNGSRPNLGKVRVEARANQPVGRRLSFQGLRWSDAGATRTKMTSTVSADGTFVIAGLEPGPHAIRVSHTDNAHLDVTNSSPTTRVSAPANTVRLDVVVAYLDVHLKPAAGGAVEVAGRTKTERIVDRGGHVRLAVIPGRPYTITVTQPGFRSEQREVIAPAGGGQSAAFSFELRPETPRATLRVRLRGDVPGHAGFGLFRPGAHTESVRRTVLAKDDVFQLDDLEPGKWRVEVLPGAAWYHPLSYYLATAGDVELVGGETHTLELDVRKGGRLRLTPQTPRGEPARCGCEILDRGVRFKPARFFVRNSGGWLESESLIGPEQTEVGPALPPGRYQLRVFGDDIVEQTLDVTVEAEKTSMVTIKVERR